MHQRSFSSSILKRLRRHLLKYPTSTSIRASIVVVRPTRARPARPEPTAHPWQRRQPSPSIELPILTPLVRPGSMPIAHAAPPHLPSSRFPPLEVFVRRPPVCATPSARGRHPKTFTAADYPGHEFQVARTSPRSGNGAAPSDAGKAAPPVTRRRKILTQS